MKTIAFFVAIVASISLGLSSHVLWQRYMSVIGVAVIQQSDGFAVGARIVSRESCNEARSIAGDPITVLCVQIESR